MQGRNQRKMFFHFDLLREKFAFEGTICLELISSTLLRGDADGAADRKGVAGRFHLGQHLTEQTELKRTGFRQ
jgi:hypothetical protein